MPWIHWVCQGELLRTDCYCCGAAFTRVRRPIFGSSMSARARRSSDTHFSRVVNRSAVPLSRTAELYLPACLRRRRRGSLSCTNDEHDAHNCSVSPVGARCAPGDARSGCARTGAPGTPVRYSDSREHPARLRRLRVLHHHRRHALGGERRRPAADAAAEWYPQRACAASLLDRARARNGRSAALRVAGRVLDRAGAVRKGSEPRRAERRPAARRAPIASDRSADRRGAGAGHAACGTAFASGAAARRRSAADGPWSANRQRPRASRPSRSLPRRRCSRPSAPTEQRARVCTYRGGGDWRPLRHSSRRLRWASSSATESPTGVPRQSHPAPRARRRGSPPPHLQRTIRLRTLRK